jgi:hypothetical protein
MDKDTIFPFVIGPIAIALFVTVFWCFDRRSKIILKRWADENGFEIVEKKQRYMFSTGPFKFWTNSRNQIIYFFRVRDRAGHERSGWARCGSYFGGVFFSDNIEIRWDETPVA